MDKSILYQKHGILVVNEEGNSLTLRSSVVKDEETCNSFLKDYGTLTNTRYVVHHSLNNPERLILRKKWICNHSRRGKKTNSPRNSNCQSTIEIKVKKVNKNTRRKDKYLSQKPPLACIIRINSEHTHNTNTPESLRFMKVTEETEKTFFDYYDNGLSAMLALKFHEERLLMEEDGTLQKLNKSNHRQVSHMHNKWKKANVDTILNPFEKLKDKIESYEKRGTIIRLHESNSWAVLIVTTIMKSVHMLETAREIIYVDSSCSSEKLQQTTTLMWTATKVGPLPIAVFIHADKSEENYLSAFSLLKINFPGCFCGKEEGPTIFMTEDCLFMKNALKSIFPASIQLLCNFHVVQSESRWLQSSKNSISEEHQKFLMKLFQAVMYSTSEWDMNIAIENVTAQKSIYPNFVKRLQNFLERKLEWALWCRSHLIENDTTNNYCELLIRILKDIILYRTRTYNVSILADSLISMFQNYLKSMLVKFAMDKAKKDAVLYQILQKKVDEYNLQNIVRNNDTYTLSAGKSNSPTYHVNVHFSTCTCKSGITGAFCKHQYFINDVLCIPFVNSPVLTHEERNQLAQITASGNYEENTLVFETSQIIHSDTMENCPIIIQNNSEASNDSFSNIEMTYEIEEVEMFADDELKMQIFDELKRLMDLPISEMSAKTLIEALQKIRNVSQIETCINNLYSNVFQKAVKWNGI